MQVDPEGDAIVSVNANLDASANNLRGAALQLGLHFGTAISTADLLVPGYVAAIRRDCTLLAAEYEMKWDAVAAAGARGYDAGDAILAFADASGIAVHGHTLWWHESVPRHLAGTPPRAFADAALQHVTQTARRYAGRLHSWDVINEPLDLAGGREDGLRASPFLEAFGPDYIGIAYRAAAEADPAAMLVLNEMGLEYGSEAAERKRRALLGLLNRELARGTPIQAVGIQSHLDAVRQPRENPGLRAFLRDIRNMGLGVMITEMDVTDHACPRDRRKRDRMVADVYRAYLDLVLEEARVLSIATWGLTDGRTWLSGFRPRADGAPVRPLPLDAAFRRKPAWHAIADALAGPGS
jgi:endo-1,4-beta-xylanase